MEELIKDNIYVIDLMHVSNVSEIIFELSSVLDNTEARNKRICLKLGDILLNKAQLLSIRSLINGIDSTLSSVDTTSPETEKVALSLGIIVSNVNAENTLEVEPEMTYKTAEEFLEENRAKMTAETTEQVVENTETTSEENTENPENSVILEQSETTDNYAEEQNIETARYSEEIVVNNKENSGCENETQYNKDNSQAEYSVFNPEQFENVTETTRETRLVEENSPEVEQNIGNLNESTSQTEVDSQNEPDATEKTTEQYGQTEEPFVSETVNEEETANTDDKEEPAKNETTDNVSLNSANDKEVDELDIIFGPDPVKSSIFDTGIPFEEESYVEKEALDDIVAPKEEFTKEDIELEEFPTKYIKQTIRSGQVISYEGNIVIIGDCHPGCEITAFGDITVWGVLSGIAHAGMGGNSKARVRALKMNAIQLRIANCYSRRPDSLNTVYTEKTNSFTPEEARIVNNEIVVFKIND